MKKIIKILLLVLTFVPFIIDRSVYFPDSTGKIFFARSILMMVSIIFLLSFIFAKKFRDEIVKKVTIFIRHPLVFSIFSFVFIFLLSTIFAVDTYNAFWGGGQRGEGFVGIVFFLTFFVTSLLIFEKEDWLWFFKLSLIVSLVLLGKEFFDFFDGVARPDSFIGNPAFLAGYLLFSIFSSILVFQESNSNFWKYFSVAVFISSFLGIFVTETRGAMLGLLLGCIGVLVYGALKGREITYKNINFRKASIAILCLLMISSAAFFVTRKSEFWQKVPGFSRVANISLDDISTRTRLLSTKSSLESVDPTKNGLKKLIIGWGPDNYILAFGKYYNQEQYRYEIDWFDRAHNQFLNTLVISGLLGLFTYLLIWFFYFKSTLYKRDFSLSTAGFMFYGISLFTYLLFLFDQISTSLPFFIILAFIIFTSNKKELEETPKQQQKAEVLSGVFFLTLVIFVCYVFFRGDVPAYMQMKKYLSFEVAVDSEVVITDIDSLFEPFTSAQGIIRRNFLVTYFKDFDPTDERTNVLYDKAFVEAEEYMDRMPFDFRFLANVAGAYSNRGKKIDNTEFLEKGEEYFRRVLTLAPNRPDYNYGLAVNLSYQNKHEEAIQILEKIIDTDPELADSYYYYALVLWSLEDRSYEDVFSYFEKSFSMKPSLFLDNRKSSEGNYNNLIKYFYDTRDKERFIQVAKRLIENDYAQSAMLSNMLQYVEGQGVWPRVEFN